MDYGKPRLFTVADTSERGFLPMHENRSFVVTLGVYPADHPHQGRLTGSIFSAEAVDLSLSDVEAHLVEGPDSGKVLCNILHFEYIFAHTVTLLPVIRTTTVPPRVPLS